MIKIDLIKENNNAKVTMKVSENLWKNSLKNAEKKLIDSLELKGFRKGNVPEAIAKQHISQDKIRTEAVNVVLDKHYSDAIDKIKDEKILSQPSISVEKISDEEVIINVIAELFPEIKIGDFSKINVSFQEPVIDENELKMEIEKSQEIFQGLKNIEDKNHKLQNGDFANIDFVGSVAGKEFEGGKAEGFDLEIGSKQFIDNFEEQLVGMKVNDEKTITVKFPEEYPVEELKGKDADFKVKLNHISKKVELEGDDLKEKLKLYNVSSVEELNKRIENMLLDKKEQESYDKFFNDFIGEVKKLEGFELNVPNSLLAQEINNEFKSFTEKLVNQGMDMKSYLKMLDLSEEDFKEKNLKIAAEDRIKNGLIYSQLLSDLDIKLTDKDFEDEYERISKNQDLSIEEVKKQLPKQMLENTLVYKKLINNLIKK